MTLKPRPVAGGSLERETNREPGLESETKQAEGPETTLGTTGTCPPSEIRQILLLPASGSRQFSPIVIHCRKLEGEKKKNLRVFISN